MGNSSDPNGKALRPASSLEHRVEIPGQGRKEQSRGLCHLLTTLSAHPEGEESKLHPASTPKGGKTGVPESQKGAEVSG